MIFRCLIGVFRCVTSWRVIHVPIDTAIAFPRHVVDDGLPEPAVVCHNIFWLHLILCEKPDKMTGEYVGVAFTELLPDDKSATLINPDYLFIAATREVDTRPPLARDRNDQATHRMSYIVHEIRENIEIGRRSESAKKHRLDEWRIYSVFFY